FSHTIFALPFALLASLLAWRQTEFRWRDLVGILLCMIFARSAAMAFNRLVDRDIDASNPRTATRHLPTGQLTPTAVRSFTLLTSAGFIASTFLFWPNRWPAFLAPPVLLFLLGYSYAKRFTIWCHYWLAAALMLSPIAAWIAITGGLDWPPALLAATVFFWVGGFDILYACQDVDFDQTRGLFSVPARFGVRRALRLAAVSHAFAAACLFGLWYVAGLGIVFLLGVIGVTILLAFEHLIVRPNDLSRVNVAFFQVNAIISLGLLALGAADLWFASGAI
ncbi:MAG: UbiA family prenyltransferase, partial [Planctomycetaceae bacterium]|nr:UbiA family prenyltransferase [Planctomycetaceae bacterium]